MSMLITYINYNLLCVTSNNLLSAPASRKFQEFSLEKRSFCLILNKRNDLLKLAVEENLRERDRFISPHGVTGALEISGKTPTSRCCICKLKYKSTSAYKLYTCM